MSSSKPKMDIYRYFMSIHYAICYGPVDAIKEIVINDKTAWSGKLSDNTTFGISKTSLFGGDKKEGGVAGTISFLNGDIDQIMPSALAQKLGLTSETCPAYRGICSAFFWNENSSSRGFYWSANVPRIPPIKFKIARASPALNEVHARIWRDDTSGQELTLSDPTAGGSFTYSDDIYGDYVVKGSQGGRTIEIVRISTGNIVATISTDYDVDAVKIIAATGHLFAWNNDNSNLYVYGLSSGTLLQTVTVLTGSGGQSLPASEITISGVPYVLVCKGTRATLISYAGGSWAALWSHDPSEFFNWDIVAIGADYIYRKGSGGSIMRFSWSPAGIGAGVSVTPPGASEVFFGIHYDLSSDRMILVGDGGHIFVTSPDLETTHLSITNGGWGDLGTGNLDNILSSRMMSDSNTIAFVTPGAPTIVEYSLSDLSLLNTYDISDWGGDTTGWFFSGFSIENRAILIGKYVGASGSRRVLFLGGTGDFDSNPSHMIYEVMTDTDFGIGVPVSSIDVASFTNAAATLYDEGFGLSIFWNEQQTVEDFVSDILTYIDGAIFVNPRTGLLTLKLIRDDYDPETLFEINPSNAKLSDFQRKLWADTINEINVNFTDPTSEEQEVVTEHNNANIAMQGYIVSDSNPYPGVRKLTLATKLAKRDLRVASSPLASCNAIVDRNAWDVTPGSCVKVTWPKHGLNGVVMRVGPIDYGKIGESSIRISLVEDVFSLDIGDYDEPTGGVWTDPDEEPDPLAYVLPFTLPYYFGQLMVDSATSANLTEDDAILGVLGAQPGNDTSSFFLARSVTDQFGNTTVEEGTELSIMSRGTIVTDLPFEVTSTVDVTALTQGESLAANMFAILGTTDANMEICLISTVSGSNVTMLRGVLDTVPKEWPAGSPIWIVPRDGVIDDEQPHSVGETVAYRALTVTSLGTLDWNLATELSADIIARPWLPNRPADVKIDGQASGFIDASGAASVEVTWANRNRLLEDSIVLDWDDATVTPESGQTTKISVLNFTDRSLLTAHSGLTGTSFPLPSSSFSGESWGIVRVESERDGFVSLQGHEFVVQIDAVRADTDRFTADTDLLTADNG